MNTPFTDRAEADRLPAERLLLLHLPGPHVVPALPHGGVSIGALVARALVAPLDLLRVRQFGLPWQPELALAAVVDADRPEVVGDESVRAMYSVDRDDIEQQTALASAVAGELDTELSPHEDSAFEDVECQLRPLVDSRGADVHVLMGPHDGPETTPRVKLCRLLFLIATLPHAPHPGSCGVRRIGDAAAGHRAPGGRLA